MKALNEFLLRFNDDGTIKGSHVRYLERYTSPSGMERSELLEPELVIEADLEALISDLNIAVINENVNLKQELEQLRSQQGIPTPTPQNAEDWKALAALLIASDFDEWLAGTFVNPMLVLHVIRLLSSLSSGDLETLYSSWLTIIAEYPPSEDQKQRWQAIADSLNITSLRFIVPV